MHRVYLRGQSLICAHGDKIPDIIESIKQGNLPVEAKSIDQADGSLNRSYFSIRTHADKQPLARLDAIITATLKKTIQTAGLSLAELQNVPILIGSVSLDIPTEEDAFNKHYLETNNASLKNLYLINVVEKICQDFGLNGEVITFNTACTSSINALNTSAEMILSGETKRVLVLGFETFNKLSFWGMESFGILSRTNNFRPFDKERDGFILGEGCGAVILDTESGSSEDFYYLGSAALCDTHTISGNEPSGSIMQKVMGEALRQAKLTPTEITAIKAHAAGSASSDLAEIHAIYNLFGKKHPPFTSLKSFVGHTLGGSGLVELIIATEAIKQGFLPKTINYQTPDDEAEIEPLKDNYPIEKTNLLLNYFGFGGSCISTVVSNIQEH